MNDSTNQTLLKNNIESQWEKRKPISTFNFVKVKNMNQYTKNNYDYDTLSKHLSLDEYEIIVDTLNQIIIKSKSIALESDHLLKHPHYIYYVLLISPLLALASGICLYYSSITTQMGLMVFGLGGMVTSIVIVVGLMVYNSLRPYPITKKANDILVDNIDTYLGHLNQRKKSDDKHEMVFEYLKENNTLTISIYDSSHKGNNNDNQEGVLPKKTMNKNKGLIDKSHRSDIKLI